MFACGGFRLDPQHHGIPLGRRYRPETERETCLFWGGEGKSYTGFKGLLCWVSLFPLSLHQCEHGRMSSAFQLVKTRTLRSSPIPLSGLLSRVGAEVWLCSFPPPWGAEFGGQREGTGGLPRRGTHSLRGGPWIPSPDRLGAGCSFRSPLATCSPEFVTKSHTLPPTGVGWGGGDTGQENRVR